MSLSTCCQLTSYRRSGIWKPSFLSVDPANLCSLYNSTAIHTTRSVIIVHTSYMSQAVYALQSKFILSSPTMGSPGQALSLHLLSRNGNCALYKSIFSALLLPSISKATHCMPDRPACLETSSPLISDDDTYGRSLPDMVSSSSFRPSTAPNGRRIS